LENGQINSNQMNREKCAVLRAHLFSRPLLERIFTFMGGMNGGRKGVAIVNGTLIIPSTHRSIFSRWKKNKIKKA
jgi:hypothetical protein